MKLIRQPSQPGGTLGTWYNDDGSILCRTIELPWDDNEPDKSCIPAADYVFRKYLSPHLGYWVWRADDVQARNNIEIHIANRARQLLGCIGVGMAFGEIDGELAVLNSQIAFNMLTFKLPDMFTLSILNSDSEGKSMNNPIANAINAAILSGIGQIVLPELTNIQGALNTIAASKGNVAVAVQQWGVIIANVNQVALVAPSLIPLLEQDALNNGASAGSNLIGELMAYIQGLATPTPNPVPAPAPSPEPAPAPDSAPKSA